MIRGGGARDTDGDDEEEVPAVDADPDPVSAAPAVAALGRNPHRIPCQRLRPGYQVHNLGTGIVGSTGAGVASALLGIGGGIVKVPLMHRDGCAAARGHRDE